MLGPPGDPWAPERPNAGITTLAVKLRVCFSHLPSSGGDWPEVLQAVRSAFRRSIWQESNEDLRSSRQGLPGQRHYVLHTWPCLCRLPACNCGHGCMYSICIHGYVNVNVNVYVYVYIHLNMCMCVCVCVPVYFFVCVCGCVCKRVRAIHAFVHMCLVERNFTSVLLCVCVCGVWL